MATQKQYAAAQAVAKKKVQAGLVQIEAAASFFRSQIEHAIAAHQAQVDAFILDMSRSITDAVVAAEPAPAPPPPSPSLPPAS